MRRYKRKKFSAFEVVIGVMLTVAFASFAIYFVSIVVALAILVRIVIFFCNKKRENEAYQQIDLKVINSTAKITVSRTLKGALAAIF